MLALSVQEQSQLRLLESSLSNTVNHQWPILHAQFIDEPTSNQDQEEQGPLKFKDQETCLPRAISSKTVDIILVPEITFYRNHYKGLYCLNSDVMLGTLERVSPMEVSATTEKMVLHESTESSPVQDRGEFLEITIHPELSTDRHKKDDQTVSEPMPELLSDKAACTEGTDHEAGLHSQQNERLSDLQPESIESPEIKEYICGKRPEIYSPTVTEPQKLTQLFIDHTHEECNLGMSSKVTCPSRNTKDGDSGLCLYDREGPLLSSTSHNLSRGCFDIQEGPVQHKETLACKEFKCCDILEINRESLLFMSSERNPSSKDTKAPTEKALENAMPGVMESSNVDDQKLEMSSCGEVRCKNVHPFTHPSPIQHVETSLEDLHSQDISKDLLTEDDGESQLTEVLSIQPSLSTSLEDRLGAKSCNASECSFSPYTNNEDISTVFSKNLICANKLQNSDKSSNTNSIVSGPSVCSCGEPTCIDSTCSLSKDIKPLSVQIRNSDVIGQEEKGTIAEKVVTADRFLCHGSIRAQEINSPIEQNHFQHLSARAEIVFCTTQTPELNMVPQATPNTVISCKMVTDVPLQMGTENSKTNRLQTSKAESEVSNADNHNRIPKLDYIMLSNPSQSLDFSVDKETNLSSEQWNEVPCQTAADHNAFQEFQTSHDDALPLKATPQNALVPYVDIWSVLTNIKVPNVWQLKPPKNLIIKKAKCQKLKESRILYAKGKGVACTLSGHGYKHGMFVHYSSPLNSLKWPLHKCPNVEYHILKTLFHEHSTGWHSRKIKSEGMPVILTTITKAKSICLSSLNSVSLRNRSVVSLLPINTSASKSKCFTQQHKNPRHLTLSSNHNVKSTDLPGHTLASSFIVSNIEHMEGIKNVASVQPMVTRSRKMISYVEPSDCLCTVKPHLLPTSPKELTLNIQADADKHRLASTVHKGQARKKYFPEIAVGAVKRKRAYMNAEKNMLNVKIDNKPLPLLDKCLLNEIPKPSLGKTTSCQVKRKGRTTKCMDNCTLKLETQSLNSCATQAAKRPKICNRNFGQPIISDLQSDADTISNTRNVYPSPPKPSSKIKDVQIVPNTGSVTCGIPVKRQPFRKCKTISFQQNIHLNPKMQACKLSSAIPAHASYIPAHKPVSSRHIVAKISSNPFYAKNSSMVTSRMKHTCLQTCTREQALLHRLSTIANRLTAPCNNSFMPKTLPSTTKVVSFRGVQLQARKLLNVFSCLNMRISSQSTGSVPATSRGRLLSQSMDLFPSSLNICPNDMAHQLPLSDFNNSTFPVSFHMKVDPSFLSDFIRFNPPDYMFKNALPVTQSSQLPEWTLSFFLSPHFPAADDNLQLSTHWSPNFRCLDSSRPNSNYRGISKRSSGCSMLGLHTILALSSPGCYRLWTRKRNLGSRIPTVQKLSVIQFAHGLKGLPPQFSQKRGVSSLAFSLGRVLSMWSHHGLSAFSDSATSHPHCRLWQPGQSINIRSPVAQLCITPNLSLGVSRWNSSSLPSLNLPLDMLPRNCLGANKPRIQFGSSSRQEIDFRPSHHLPFLSNSVSVEGVGLWHSHTRINEQGNNIGPLNSLSANQEESLLSLCTEETSGLKPLLPLSVKHADYFRPWHGLFKGQDDAVGPSDLSSCKQNNGIDHVHCFSIQQDNNLGLIDNVLIEQDYAIRLDNCFPAELVDGLGPQCSLPSEPSDCHRPLCSSFSENPCLSAQDAPRFPHSLPTEQGSAFGPSQFLSSKQDDHLEYPCSLSPSETDGPETQPSLSAQKQCDNGPTFHQFTQEDNHFCHPLCLFSKQGSNPGILHNMSNQQNGDLESMKNVMAFLHSDPKTPCLLLPTKAKACSLERRETVPVLHAKAEHHSQDSEKQEVERKPQRVSQIKIRKTIPKPDPNLTPMGLPKPKRINKKEFTLEDIYTNKNYKSPPQARSLETIFEEPKEKNGVLVSVSQTKRKRILEFRDCTLPRPKRAKGKVKIMASCKRGRKAAMEGVQLDALLIQKLMDLENFLSEQESLERGSATSENLS